MGCKKVCPPNLRHSVSVRAEIHTPDGAGGTTVLFAEKFTVWTHFTLLSAGEQWKQQKLNSEGTHKFTLRFRDDILTTDNILIYGIEYNIVSIENVDMQSQWLVIIAKSGVVQ